MTANKIRRRIAAKGRGAVFTPSDFLDLGSRAAIDQALSRFTERQVVRRTAYPPTLKLMPGTKLKQNLKTDYGRMSEMLFDEAEPFERLLGEIEELERKINTKARTTDR